MGSRGAEWLKEPWTEKDRKYDSDPDVKKAMKGLEKAKHKKKAREAIARDRAADEAMRRAGAAAEMSRRPY